MRRSSIVVFVLAVLAGLLPLGAAAASGASTIPSSVSFVAAGRPAPRVWRGSGHDAPVRSWPMASLRTAAADRPQTSTWQVTYTGFSLQQQAAFQAAVDIWSRIVVSSVPIRVKATLSQLQPGVLGSAGPYTAYRSGGSYYAVALANSLAGRDLDTANPDIEADFTNDPSLIYYGTDGQPPAGTYDFTTIVLHELCHGLGFLGDLEVVNGTGTYDSGSTSPTPFIYDRNVAQRTSSGLTPVLNYTRGSSAMTAALQSNSVYWNGSGGIAGAGGTTPRLYAPTTWEDGSSIGHLDEATYPTGNINALMTPVADRREVIRDPGSIVKGMFKDEGWKLSAADDPTTAPSASSTPTATGAPTAGSSPSSSPSTAASTSPSTAPSSSPSTATSFAPSPSASPAASGTTDGLSYSTVAPRRVLDTRDGTGARKGTVPAGQYVDLDVRTAGVPTQAKAVVLNVTAVGATASTDVRVYPADSAGVPGVSNLNLTTGQTRANLVTVAVSSAGVVRLRNGAGSVHLLADLAGYYAPVTGASFFPIAPDRALDTRNGIGRLGAGQAGDLTVADGQNVPSNATAVVLSVTAVGATQSTDVRVYPTPATGDAVPLVSNLNVVPGGPVPNLVIVPVGNAGQVRLRNAAGSVHLVVDVYGYYAVASGGSLFRPLSPQRILDTRPDRLGAAQTLDVRTASAGGVPSSATAVALNVTGVGASDGTDVRIYPSPLTNTAAPPTVSTLNLVRGQTAADAAIVPTGNGSAVRLYNSSGSLALTVDVAGWFGPA